MAFDVQKTNIEITATDKTSAAFNSVKSSIGNLTSQFGALTGIIGAGAFVAFTKRIIDQADSMNDLSKRTGIAVEQIGAWRLATEQSGTSMDALTNALGKGSKYLVQHGDDLKKIGITAKTSEELILQLSGVISQLPSDDPRRVALAMQVLGKSAGELIPLLSEGEQALRKNLDATREWNKLTPEMAKDADEFNDSLAQMKFVSGGLFVNLVGSILPSLNTYLKQLQAVVNEGDWLDKLGFFTLGYVPGKIADKTEKPEVQIQKYTQRIIELKKELAEFSGVKFGYRKDGILAQITEAEAGLAAQRARLPFKVPKRSSAGTSFDATNLDAFLKSDSGGAPKKDAIAERIKALGIENSLLAQGVPLEDARTIARLKADGATDQQIVKMLNATAVQNQFEAAEKAGEKTKQDLIKATEDHAEAMRKMLETADEAVLSAQRDTAESERGLQVMQLGESAVIRMEVARLQEAAASAEQGLAYARLNGLSQENIDFTETQILRLHQLAEARLGLADSTDAKAAFEKEKDRIKDLEKEQKDAAKRVADEQKRLSDSMSQSLTDALLRGFENGKGFAKNFRDTLINMFKSLILQPVIKFLVDSSGISAVLGALGSAFSGGASAATGAGGGGTFGGLLGGIKSIFSGGNDAIVSAIGSLGQSLSAFGSTGTSFIKDIASSLGSFTQLNAGLIANVSAFSGAALSLLKGDFKGAAFQGVGAGIGLALGGPIGGAIGSFLGGALGGMFGGKKKIPRFSSQSITNYSNGAFSTTSGTPVYKALGATGQTTGLNEAFIKMLAPFLESFGVNSDITAKTRVIQKRKASYAEFWGGGISEGVQGSAKTTQKTFEDLIEKVLGSGVAKAIGASALPAGVKKFFDGLTKKEDVAEAINTLVSLKTALVDLPPVFNAIRNAIDTTAYKTSIADLKSRFSAVSTYTSLFYSEQENFDTFTKQLVTQLTALNTVLPSARDQYRALVDGIKVVDEQTSNQFHGLVALAPAMDAYFKQLEAQKNALNDLSALMDESSFKTLFDYNFYKGLADNYGTSFANQYNAGAVPTYGASNNTSVSLPLNVTPSNNTTISTSDPNMLNAMATLIARVDSLQVALNATQVNTKSTAQTLVNVTGNGGDALQTVAVA
jgi:hypothetical protein